MVRLIELTEWRPKTISLNRAERDELLDHPLVSVRPLGGDEYELKPGSIVGTSSGEHTRVLVKPKIPPRNVFFLLGYSLGLGTWRTEEAFSYAAESDLLTAMAEFFEASVARAERRGVVREYVDRSDALPTVRGRVDIAAQVRRRQGAVLPLECRFQEYELDHPLNRVLKAGLTRIRALPGLGPELRRRLAMRARSFAEVEDVRFDPSQLPELTFTRLNRDWEGAARLAELILRRTSLADRPGPSSAMTFSLDMNRVFEKFVERVMQGEARKRGWQLVPQARRKLSRDVTMVPDLVLCRQGVDYAVADTKYKRVQSDQWPNADIYQLLSYCIGMGLPAGTLIYGEHPGIASQAVMRHGSSVAQLEMVGVDLSGPSQEVLRRAQAAAGHALDQAARAFAKRRRAANTRHVIRGDTPSEPGSRRQQVSLRI